MATVLEQVSCENPANDTLYSAFLAPVRSLFNMSKHESLFIYAWLTLVVIYILIYYAVPISFLNSNNGFKSGWVTLVSTLIIYTIIVIVFVLWTHDSACQSKAKKAAYYVYGKRPLAPRYLSKAIERVQSLPANRDRKPIQWTETRIEYGFNNNELDVLVS
jgi:magnesium-transporting ATPase (P-type)